MFESQTHPILFAHRGSSAHAPENTLAAFRCAREQGADGIELDAKLCADGQVVIMHDPTVDRTTSGSGRVSSMTFSEIRALDAGLPFAASFEGEGVPTLDEALDLAGRDLLVNVELTNYTTPDDGLVKAVCSVVRRHAAQSQMLFSSFLARNLAKCAALMPEASRGLLALPGWKGAWARSAGFMFGRYGALHPNINDVTPQQVQRVHRLGRRIHVWTVNRAEEVVRLRDWGVDGIFTDDPLMAGRSLGRSH